METSGLWALGAKDGRRAFHARHPGTAIVLRAEKYHASHKVSLMAELHTSHITLHIT